VTVLQGIQRSAEFLAKKGVDSPRLQAELLLARVVGLARMQLYLNFERALSAAETNALREFINVAASASRCSTSSARPVFVDSRSP